MKRLGLFSIIFYAYFFIGIVLGACAVLILFLCTFMFDHKRSLLHVLMSRWAYHFVQINPGWKVIWQGRENLAHAAPCIIVSNHQSVFDAFVVYGLKHDFRWMGKDWVFNFPIIGWLLALGGHVRVHPKSATQALKTCEFWLQNDVSILIFPEGTRSPDGSLLPFRSGAFRLAVAEKVPIVPMIIEGTRSIMPKYSCNLNPCGIVEVRILPAIHPADFENDFHKLRAQVRQAIESQLQDMRSPSVVN